MNMVNARYRTPEVYGNEEETGLLVHHGDENGYQEPHVLASHIGSYIPGALAYQDRFLSNGGKLYLEHSTDDSHGPSNIERATPECASPLELTKYIRSNEALLVHIVSNYASDMSKKSGRNVNARIQRRVVDGSENRKGCHDNFSVHPAEICEKKLTNEQMLGRVILGHIATRSFVTGAGYVKPNKDIYFAQKIGGLGQTKGYGLNGSMYRFDSCDNDRLEVRCNDINISDWAVRMRIGATALAITIAKTPLKNVFPELDSHNRMYKKAMLFNRAGAPNPDGSIVSSRLLRQALAYQRTIATLALEELEQYTGELGEEMLWTAYELKRYCDDFERVISGEDSIEVLADRADWAAKLSRIHEDYLERSTYEIASSYTDIRAQYLDLKYDHISIKARNGRLRKPSYGYGYDLRDNGSFLGTVSKQSVASGMLKPPQSTRAKARADIIKHEDVANASWSWVNYTHKGAMVSARLEDPSLPSVTRAVSYSHHQSRL